MLARRFRDQLLEPHAERSDLRRHDQGALVAAAFRGGAEHRAEAKARVARRRDAGAHRGDGGAGAAQQFGDVDAEQRARHDAEVGKRRIAPAEVGIGAKHPAEVLLGRQVVQLGARVGHHGELLGPSDPIPEEVEMAAGLERAAGFGGEDEEGSVGRQLLGVAMDGAGVARVQHPEIEPARADPERVAQHLRKQARSAHAAPQDMGEAIVLKLLGEGLEILDLLFHLMGRHQPAERLEISVGSRPHSV